MIESRMYRREAELGLTGGALRRRQALRVVRDGTITTAEAPQASAVQDRPVRLRADRTFAQHGVLTAPNVLVVRIAVENVGPPLRVSAVDVAFEVPGTALDADAAAGWHGPAEGWSFTFARRGERIAVTLVHRGPVAPGELLEATFRLRVAPDAHLGGALTLRATGHADVHDGAWSSDLTVPVERLSL